MPRERPEERCAREVVTDYLKVDVDLHDTGTQASMVDLHLTIGDETVPLEITTATDEWYKKLEAAFKKRGSTDLYVPEWRRSWFFLAGKQLRVKDLERKLRGLPLSIEDELVRMPHTFMPPRQISELGIDGAMEFDLECPGQIVMGIHIPHGTLELPDITGEWVSEFLKGPSRADVLHKVGKYQTSQRHVFIWVEGTAPRSVRNALRLGPFGRLPALPPDLPDQVTHLWLGSLQRPSPTVIAWFPDRQGWREICSPPKAKKVDPDRETPHAEDD